MFVTRLLRDKRVEDSFSDRPVNFRTVVSHTEREPRTLTGEPTTSLVEESGRRPVFSEHIY